MSDDEEWAFPESLQPNPRETGFDLDRTLDAVVALRAEIPEDAFTASALGTERAGNGVVISENGVVLTIGYLIAEAQQVWLSTNRGAVVPAYPLAYDQATGFGLVRALGPFDAPALVRGSTADCQPGDPVLVIGQGGRAHALKAKVIARREFAGYWEYVLDEALFTAPAHPNWGGTALVGEDGRLLGIGSLLLEEAVDGRSVQCNMVVPVDLLEPILENLLTTGVSGVPAHPWLGLYATDYTDYVVVAGLAGEGPAEQAGVETGDMVLAVAGQPVSTLIQLFRLVWALGPAGTVVPLTLSRDGATLEMELRSADRTDFLKGPQLH